MAKRIETSVVPAKVDKHLDLRTKAKELRKTFECNLWEFIEVIYQICKTKAWKDWGHSSAKEYFEEELQFSESTIRNGLSAYEHFLELGPGVAKEFKVIGVSKAEILAPIVNDDNVDELLKMAKKQSLRELSKSVQSFKTQVPKPKTPAPEAKVAEPTHHASPASAKVEPPIEPEVIAPASPTTMTINFQDPIDRDTVSDALRICEGKYPDLETADQKLGMIATVFLSIHGEDEDADPILRLIQTWENMFDTQFVVVIDGEIAYGEDVFREMKVVKEVQK